jgi:hypothetical protein
MAHTQPANGDPTTGRPLTREDARRARQEQHRRQRQEDYARRLGEWAIVQSWVDEAKYRAKQQQLHGNQAAVIDLARTLESFCNRYRR